MTIGLAAHAATQTRSAALTAIVTALNTARQTSLDAARADYVAQHGTVAPNFPKNGPVLPECALNDPRDIQTDQSSPNTKPKLRRRLTLFSGKANPGRVFDRDTSEPVHLPQLEFMLIVPAHVPIADWQAVHDAGLHEIENALLPLTGSGLPGALTFALGNLDFYFDDLGDHGLMAAAFLDLDMTLDARSVLS